MRSWTCWLCWGVTSVTLRDLSWRNARRQARDYLVYFVTIIIATALMYAFNGLVFSREIAELSAKLSSLPLVIVLASVAVVLILGWLVAYITRFMLTRRSRELGTYLLIGLEHRQVARLFFLENLAVGAVALVLGVVLGNLMFQILRAIMLALFGVEYRLSFAFSLEAVGMTLLYVLLVYLLALGRTALILAAMDTGSSFEGMGASREALYGALVEPALMLVFGTLALLSGYTSFDTIFSGDAVNGVQLVVVLLLAAYVLVKIVFTEAGRVPVDDPRTHLELTMIHEVMCLDYCGVDLAYIKMAGWLKTAALSVLAADAVAATCCPRWWAAAPLAVLVTGLSVGIVESTQARNKLARNTTFILTVAALAVLVFFTGYLLQLNIGLQ